ncbi:transposase InsO family protein [Bradyrhizobium sp. USDA 3311]|nr:transposase InsO family protein [Bradyrhizobium japonicum]
MNHKKFRRLYREERLQVRRRGGRKRALGTRAPLAIPQGANQRWSLDFLSDAFADGSAFWLWSTTSPAKCLALVADTSLPGLRVVRELDVIIAWRGRPALCLSDNGTELTGMAVLRFQPGKADRLALHRAPQTDSECLHREFQRAPARRTSQ